MAKILGIFSKEPLIWFHYVLLVGIILIYYKYMGVKIANMDWMFVLGLYLVISLSDQIIHKILNVD